MPATDQALMVSIRVTQTMREKYLRYVSVATKKEGAVKTLAEWIIGAENSRWVGDSLFIEHVGQMWTCDSITLYDLNGEFVTLVYDDCFDANCIKRGGCTGHMTQTAIQVSGSSYGQAKSRFWAAWERMNPNRSLKFRFGAKNEYGPIGAF